VDPFKSWTSTLLAPLEGRALTFQKPLIVAFLGTVLAVLLQKYEILGLFDMKFHGLFGAPVSVLLGMRVTAGYSRWWEARGLWGSIVNMSRNACRTISGYTSSRSSEEEKEVAKTCAYVTAFAASARRHLRDENVLPELEGVLAADEIEDIIAARSKPQYCLGIITGDLQKYNMQGRLNDLKLTLCDVALQRFEDALGACERIKKTPQPFGLVALFRTLLSVYLLTLPAALFSPTTPAIVAFGITFLVSVAMFGMEQIGTELEMPFGYDRNDLPLKAITTTITGDVEWLSKTFTDNSPIPEK